MVELEVPDKGRAWVIAFSACIINMILSGLSRMVSYLYVAVLDAYGVTRQEATLPFAVRNSIRCLAGPVVGIIGQSYGIRNVTFWGGVIAASGAALCSIAPNVAWLAVFWGGIHGFGFAFANTLFQVAVNQYFLKYRATASGIALSGACVGSLGFPFMIETIINVFGLSGGFLILGGIIMHVLPPSLLLKAPAWVEYPEAYARQWALKHATESVETIGPAMSRQISVESDEELNLNTERARTTSLSDCPVEELRACHVSRSNLKMRQNKGVMGQLEKIVSVRRSEMGVNVVCTSYQVTDPVDKLDSQNGYKISEASIQKPVVFSISDKIPQDEGIVEDINMSEKSAAEKEQVEPRNTVSIKDSIISSVLLFTNPVYLLISLCMSIYVIIFIPILTVIVDYSKDKGLEESSGKYLINAMALGDLIGRLCFGWVTDKGFMTIPAFMTTTMILQGTFIILFPFAMSLFSFMALLAFYGCTGGSLLVLFPVLVLKYVREDEQSVAIGCVGFLSGIVSFAIPVMIGHFRDHVGSYDGMFYLTGVVSVASGCLWLLEPVLVKRYFRSKEFEEQNDANTEIAIQNNIRDFTNDKDSKYR